MIFFNIRYDIPPIIYIYICVCCARHHRQKHNAHCNQWNDSYYLFQHACLNLPSVNIICQQIQFYLNTKALYCI